VRPNWNLPLGGEPLEDAERCWACLLSALARTKGLHAPQVSLGNALAFGEYSELRFVRFLRAKGTALFKEIELMAQYLNSKAQPVDWTQVAEILFTRDEDKAESLRRKIARDYYNTLKHKEE